MTSKKCCQLQQQQQNKQVQLLAPSITIPLQQQQQQQHKNLNSISTSSIPTTTTSSSSASSISSITTSPNSPSSNTSAAQLAAGAMLLIQQNNNINNTNMSSSPVNHIPNKYDDYEIGEVIKIPKPQNDVKKLKTFDINHLLINNNDTKIMPQQQSIGLLQPVNNNNNNLLKIASTFQQQNVGQLDLQMQIWLNYIKNINYFNLLASTNAAQAKPPTTNQPQQILTPLNVNNRNLNNTIKRKRTLSPQSCSSSSEHSTLSADSPFKPTTTTQFLLNQQPLDLSVKKFEPTQDHQLKIYI